MFSHKDYAQDGLRGSTSTKATFGAFVFNVVFQWIIGTKKISPRMPSKYLPTLPSFRKY